MTIFGKNKIGQKRPKRCESPCKFTEEKGYLLCYFIHFDGKICKTRHFFAPNIVAYVAKGRNMNAGMDGRGRTKADIAEEV
jgi:hypothetical protein